MILHKYFGAFALTRLWYRSPFLFSPKASSYLVFSWPPIGYRNYGNWCLGELNWFWKLLLLLLVYPGYVILFKVGPGSGGVELISLGLQARGALAWKEVLGCATVKTPFSRLSYRSQGSQVRQKLVHKPFIWMKNVTFPLKASIFHNIRQFSARKAQVWPQFWSKSLKICKRSVLVKPLFSKKIRSQAYNLMSIITSPSSSAGRTYLPEKKLSAPYSRLTRRLIRPVSDHGHGVYSLTGYGYWVPLGPLG